jgi:predicted Zn-dependent protease
MHRRKLTTLVLLLSSLAIACAVRKPGEPIRPGINLFSKQQDIELGREAASEVRKQIDVVDNNALQNYVTVLGQRIARLPEANNFPYSFTLVNDKSINAFALPGGSVFLNTGVILAAEDEAQVTGVLAHEVAHVALRHGTNQVSKANIAQLPAVLASTAIGEGSLTAQLAQLGIGLGLNSLLLKYSRDAESQADALGARMMAKLGYNPIEMARFFENLQAEGGSRAPQFLSSHPNPGNRVKAVEAEIQYLPQRQYNARTGEFSEMKALTAGLPPPKRTLGQ